MRGSAADSRTSGLRITGAPEAAEDLAADGVVPVAEGVANRTGAGGPRPPAKDLVLVAEEGLGVLGIGERLEARPRPEVAGGPLPDITDHAATADGRAVPRVRGHRRGAEAELIQVGERTRRRLIPPGIAELARGAGVPRCRRLPLCLARQ